MKQKNTLHSDGSLSVFCRQMAILLRSGISKYQCLEMLLEDPEDKTWAHALEELNQALIQEGSLSLAMEKTETFPRYLVRLTRLGEETGRLDEVMDSLADHYQREDQLHRSIRDAVVYPAAMLAMLAAVCIVLMTKVMPIFDRIFAQLGTRLTGFSRILLDLGQGLREYAFWIAVVCAILVAVGIYLAKNHTLRRLICKYIPFFRKMQELTNRSRFLGSLSMGLASGLSADYALELAQEVTEDEAFLQRTKPIADAMHQGSELVEAMKKQNLLSGQSARFALVGEKTGTLAYALNRAADLCREEAQNKVALALGLIEPVLVTVLSLVVGGMLLSVLMPMLSILSSL